MSFRSLTTSTHASAQTRTNKGITMINLSHFVPDGFKSVFHSDENMIPFSVSCRLRGKSRPHTFGEAVGIINTVLDVYGMRGDAIPVTHFGTDEKGIHSKPEKHVLFEGKINPLRISLDPAPFKTFLQSLSTALCDGLEQDQVYICLGKHGRMIIKKNPPLEEPEEEAVLSSASSEETH